jgi:hypothetical protein
VDAGVPGPIELAVEDEQSGRTLRGGDVLPAFLIDCLRGRIEFCLTNTYPAASGVNSRLCPFAVRPADCVWNSAVTVLAAHDHDT